MCTSWLTRTFPVSRALLSDVVTTWRVDDVSYDDRVDALAAALSRPGARLDGPAGPVCRTNRDLYRRLMGAGEQMRSSGRTLDEFLRAWWRVGTPLAGRDRLDLDTVAAMVTAAATVGPAPREAAWRETDYPYGREGFRGWEDIVLSQIADLADFADAGPLDEWASLGVTAPRPPGRERALGGYWFNFTPRSYLECGLAGSIGGWDPSDGYRIPVPGEVVELIEDPGPDVFIIESLGWEDLADIARNGQMYE
jgi:hypothetical protein